MIRERRVRLRFDRRGRIWKSLAEVRALRDIESICRLLEGARV